MSDAHTELRDEYEAKLKVKRELIKDLRYLIDQLARQLVEREREILYLRQFPDAALKEAAQKILSDKNLRKESMKRWKDTDDE